MDVIKYNTTKLENIEVTGQASPDLYPSKLTTAEDLDEVNC